MNQKSKKRSINYNLIIGGLSGFLVALVALISFILSYSALQGYAETNGLTTRLSYLWPLLIDGPLVIFSVAVLAAYLQGEKSKKLWALVIFYTGLTLAFNAVHAIGDTDILHPTSQKVIVAMVAPLGLFFSIEVFFSQVSTWISKRGISKSLAAKTSELSILTTEHTQSVEVYASELAELKEQKAQIAKQLKNARDTIQPRLEAVQARLSTAQSELSKVQKETAKAGRPDDTPHLKWQQAYQADGMIYAGFTKSKTASILGIADNTLTGRLALVNGSGLKKLSGQAVVE